MIHDQIVVGLLDDRLPTRSKLNSWESNPHGLPKQGSPKQQGVVISISHDSEKSWNQKI